MVRPALSPALSRLCRARSTERAKAVAQANVQARQIHDAIMHANAADTASALVEAAAAAAPSKPLASHLARLNTGSRLVEEVEDRQSAEEARKLADAASASSFASAASTAMSTIGQEGGGKTFQAPSNLRESQKKNSLDARLTPEKAAQATQPECGTDGEQPGGAVRV